MTKEVGDGGGDDTVDADVEADQLEWADLLTLVESNLIIEIKRIMINNQ